MDGGGAIRELGESESESTNLDPVGKYDYCALLTLSVVFSYNRVCVDA